MTKEQKIQEQISKQLNQPVNQVILANRAMFEFLKKEIESGERKPVRIWKMGVFMCKPTRVKKLKEKGLLHD